MPPRCAGTPFPPDRMVRPGGSADPAASDQLDAPDPPTAKRSRSNRYGRRWLPGTTAPDVIGRYQRRGRPGRRDLQRQRRIRDMSCQVLDRQRDRVLAGMRRRPGEHALRRQRQSWRQRGPVGDEEPGRRSASHLDRRGIRFADVSARQVRLERNRGRHDVERRHVNRKHVIRRFGGVQRVGRAHGKRVGAFRRWPSGHGRGVGAGVSAREEHHSRRQCAVNHRPGIGKRIRGQRHGVQLER